jgi:hypothetical protein
MARARQAQGTFMRPPNPPPPSVPMPPPQDDPIPDPQPTAWERVFSFFENGIVLAVMGIIGSLAGVFIDGRYFLLLCVPLALGLHRSAALKGLAWPKKLLGYSLLFVVSVPLLWLLGVGTEKARTHIPTPQEIASAIASLSKPKPAPPDPIYPAPNGKAVRMEGVVEPPSNQMCRGMSDEDEIKCLCPSPLDYTLRALDSPSDNNYATEIDIKQVNRPIYRARVFARTMVDARHGYVPDPPNDSHSASFLGTLAYDPFSFVISATAPKKGFKVTVHSSEGLRLKCINQEN